MGWMRGAGRGRGGLGDKEVMEEVDGRSGGCRVDLGLGEPEMGGRVMRGHGQNMRAHKHLQIECPFIPTEFPHSAPSCLENCCERRELEVPQLKDSVGWKPKGVF